MEGWCGKDERAGLGAESEAVPNSQGQNMDIEGSNSSDDFCLELGNV